jgi:hypothetical protein
MSVTPTKSQVFLLSALALVVADQVVPPLIYLAGGVGAYGVGTLADTALAVLAGFALILAAVFGGASKRGKVLGVVFAGAFILIALAVGSVTSILYSGLLVHDLIDGAALALALLSWAIARPFRGPGYFALIAVAVFAMIGFLLTSPLDYLLPKTGPVWLYLVYAAMVLATVGLAVLLERQPVTTTIVAAVTSSRSGVSARVSAGVRPVGAWVSSAWAATTPDNPAVAAADVEPGSPISETPVGFGIASWNTAPVQPTGSLNGKARTSLGLALGALVLNLFGRGIPTLSSVTAILALAILVVAVVLGHLARREIRRTNERGAGVALAGLIIGYIVFAVNVMVTILVLVFVSSYRP